MSDLLARGRELSSLMMRISVTVIYTRSDPPSFLYRKVRRQLARCRISWCESMQYLEATLRMLFFRNEKSRYNNVRVRIKPWELPKSVNAKCAPLLINVQHSIVGRQAINSVWNQSSSLLNGGSTQSITKRSALTLPGIWSSLTHFFHGSDLIHSNSTHLLNIIKFVG